MRQVHRILQVPRATRQLADGTAVWLPNGLNMAEGAEKAHPSKIDAGKCS
jgi:hypothetical protein